MPRGKAIYDNEGESDADKPRPGPTDQGRDGGMATRENAPDVAEPTEEPTA
ncbi:hypothetical protein [Mycolicibacterium sp. XJ1819]